MTAARPAGATVKCMVWDLDNTLLTGVFLESAEPPAADPVLAALLPELGGRGILHAIASKNPPEAAGHAERVTGWRFAAAECGWGGKPEALTRIAAELNLGLDSLAFVDDDPYERAEVAATLPQVLVLSPEEAAEAAGWPEFSPPVITAEARRRGEMYAQRRRRQQAERAFAGSRDEFLATAGTRVTIAAASQRDLPRLAELASRTHQFNSLAGWPGAEPRTGDWFAARMASPGNDVLAVRLRDAFGDDGLVGGCVVDRRKPAWRVELLMMSCRAMGRGVIDGLLAWLIRQAARAGAGTLEVACTVTGRNVPLRLALAAAGFRAGTAGQQQTGDGPVRFRRNLAGSLPALPGWVRAPGGQGPAQP